MRKLDHADDQNFIDSATRSSTYTRSCTTLWETMSDLYGISMAAMGVKRALKKSRIVDRVYSSGFDDHVELAARRRLRAQASLGVFDETPEGRDLVQAVEEVSRPSLQTAALVARAFLKAVFNVCPVMHIRYVRPPAGHLECRRMLPVVRQSRDADSSFESHSYKAYVWRPVRWWDGGSCC